MTSEDRIVLLFVHGGGFNKETWKPIIAHIKDSLLLRRVPCTLESMDLPFHGASRDETIAPVLWYDGPKQKWPRVDHPAKNWPQWAPEALHKHIQSIRSGDNATAQRTRVVVVAHSIGATAAMLLEMANPGILDGLVAFEPICNGNMAPEMCVIAANVMVANTMAREAYWKTWDDVVAHFRTTKMFSKWHPDALAAYLEGAVTEQHSGDEGFVLAMSPMQEAALYCYDIVAATFSLDQYARMQCPVVFEHGDQTMLFGHEVKREVAEMMPTIFTLAPPLKGLGHLMILEDPVACADRVVADLAKFPVFQQQKPLAMMGMASRL